MMGVLRQAGVRVTPQREAIYREIVKTDEHPDAETIFKRIRERMPTVSLDTVYRTLNTLAENGLLSRVQVASGRVRFDANLDQHHHFVCGQCGLVRDFYSQQLDRFVVPPDVEEWGTVNSVHLQLRGVCSRCLGSAQA